MAEFDPLDLETNMSILSILFFLQFIHAYKFICHGNIYLALLTVIFVLPMMSTFFLLVLFLSSHDTVLIEHNL